MNNEKNVLVTIQDRERMAAATKSYGKEGIYVNIVDFEKEITYIQKTRKKNPIVSIIPIKEDIYKNNLSGYTCVKDPLYGVYYGIPVGILPDGNVKWRRIYIEEKYSFNLSIKKDCMEYIVMRMHPDVEGSPFENASPKYRIYDPELEAQKVSIKARDTRKCFDIIDEITGKNLVYFCRNLGILQENEMDISTAVLKSRLESFAMENPTEFIRRYEQESRSLRETFKTGLGLGIIRNKGADGFEYSGRLLGLHEESVINYLKQYPEVAIQLSREVEESDNLTIEIQKEEKTVIGKNKGNKKDDKDNEKEKDKNKKVEDDM